MPALGDTGDRAPSRADAPDELSLCTSLPHVAWNRILLWAATEKGLSRRQIEVASEMEAASSVGWYTDMAPADFRDGAELVGLYNKTHLHPR